MRKTLTQALLAAFCAILARGTSAAHVEGGGVMQIASRVSIWSGARAPTAKDYVQNGLIALWDGIENAGWGLHDPDATTWKDLTDNGYDLGVSSLETSWSDNKLSSPRRWLARSLKDIPLVSCGCVFDFNSAKVERIFVARNSRFVYIQTNTDGQFGIIQGGQGVVIGALAGISTPSVSFNLSGSTGQYNLIGCWVNSSSVPIVTSGSGMFNNAGGGIVLGGRNASSVHLETGASIYNLRIYSRALTADEIAHNYAIDKERFGLT